MTLQGPFREPFNAIAWTMPSFSSYQKTSQSDLETFRMRAHTATQHRSSGCSGAFTGRSLLANLEPESVVRDLDAFVTRNSTKIPGLHLRRPRSSRMANERPGCRLKLSDSEYSLPQCSAWC